MKDFHEWLADLTEDLRDVSTEEKPQDDPAIDYNAIHDPMISAIKSIMWRDQNKRPMEDRIHDKINNLQILNGKIRRALSREVHAGLRSQQELDEYDMKTGSWLRELEIVASKTPSGSVPKVNSAGHYQPWTIRGI